MAEYEEVLAARGLKSSKAASAATQEAESSVATAGQPPPVEQLSAAPVEAEEAPSATPSTTPSVATPPPAVVTLTLGEQVRAAIGEYAFGGEHGRLKGLFAAHELPWDEAVATRLVEMASKQIGASVESRGETSYALEGAAGSPNKTRVASVQKYLEKLVSKRAERARAA